MNANFPRGCRVLKAFQKKIKVMQELLNDFWQGVVVLDRNDDVDRTFHLIEQGHSFSGKRVLRVGRDVYLTVYSGCQEIKSNGK